MKNSIDTNVAAKTLVLGLGKTGLACAQFLSRQQTVFKCADNRERPPMLEQYLQQWSRDSIELGCFNKNMLANIETVIVSPGVSWKESIVQEALHRGLHVMSDIELFARHANAPIIAITGSNGKSTVTTLLGEMICAAGLKAQMGGNLGTPALALLAEETPDFYVLEVSSFHLDLTHYLPTVVSIVLNVSQDHMDRYDSVEEYVASKSRIYQQAAVGVINKDDHAVLKMHDQIPRVIYFTEHSPHGSEFGLANYRGKIWLALNSERLLPVDDLKIKGKHNAVNVLACLALGQAIGLPMKAMLNAAENFHGLPHRCQWVAEVNGVNFCNDSKATNVGAAIAAISSMQNKIVLIAGGDGKGASFTKFGQVISKHARAVVLLGRDAELIAKVIRSDIKVQRVQTMQEAVPQAFSFAQPGDVILLAPGCSSLDMFASYEERGDLFSAAVREFAREHQA